MAGLDRRQFDIVVVEALDRLGSKLVDVADLHDGCAFAGVKLFAVNVGEITAMLGTMAQLYLSDMRDKTWCGQRGRALQGKMPGGKAYGDRYGCATRRQGQVHEYIRSSSRDGG